MPASQERIDPDQPLLRRRRNFAGRKQGRGPRACITRVVSWKDHANHDPPQAPEDESIEINLSGRVEQGTVTSESRQRSCGSTVGGITELRIRFDVTPGAPGPEAVSIWEQRNQSGCPQGTAIFLNEYVNAANWTCSPTVVGNELILTIMPGLENQRVYKFWVNTTVTRVGGQTFQVRCLTGDVTDDRMVNATDRSVVVGVWTGSGYRAETDINLDGFTDGVDRSIVVGIWTNPNQNCAP